MSAGQPTQPIYRENRDGSKGELLWNLEGEIRTPDDCHKRIVRIHNSTKATVLLAEQVSVTQDFFLQAMNEQRNALDHIVRAKSCELGMPREGTENNNPEIYILENLKKAIGHEYRAFFDAADILSIELVNQIKADLQPYDSEDIEKVIPTYHTEIQPKIRRIRLSIAKVREDKDVTKGNDLKDIDDYTKILKELSTYWENLALSKPDLIKRKRERIRKENLTKYGLLLTAGLLIVAVLGLVLNFMNSRNPAPASAQQPAPTTQQSTPSTP